MKTFRSQRSEPARHEALSRIQSLSSSSMSPLSLSVLLILTIPGCTSAPADLQRVTINQRHLLQQIDTMCSSYLSADLRFRTSDVLGELCVLMLIQKSKEQRVPESKRSSQFHPILRLVSQLHTRGERGLLMRAELQGPGGIESRGYFLYRPRNGRRSLEYE